MRKFIALTMFGLLALGTLQSCDDRTDGYYNSDNDTYSVMKDVTGTLNATNNYSVKQNINIPATDVVLVYRNINSNTSAGAVWQLIPKTEYMSGGRELDYNFLFNTSMVEIYSEATVDQATFTAAENAKYLINQTFRIVLVPASQAKTAEQSKFEDYNWVVKTFNLKEPK